ncbi:MAG: YfhO family protein [Planctomycetota bacterium]
MSPRSGLRRVLGELPHLALGLVLLEWLFRRVWLLGDVALGSDVGLFAIPRFELLSQLWCQGTLPGWNPWFAGGAPLYGDLSFAVLYPGNAALWLLEPLDALGVSLMAHLALTFVGTYAVLRDRGVGRHAAAIVGLGVGLGGVALGQLQTPIYVAATGWLPWCVLGFTRCARAPSGRRLALAALPFALTFLAGAPENCLSAAAVALCASRGATGRPWLELAGRLALVGLLAAALCGALLVPALGVIADSTRAAGLSAGEAGRWSLSPLQLAQLAAPLRVGHGALPVELLLSDYRPWHAWPLRGGRALRGALLGLREAARGGPSCGGPGVFCYARLRLVLAGLRAPERAARCGRSATPPSLGPDLVPAEPAGRLPPRARRPRPRPAPDVLAALASVSTALGLGLAAAWGGSAWPAALGALAAGAGRSGAHLPPAARLLALTLCDLALAGALVVETAPRTLFAPPQLAEVVAAAERREVLQRGPCRHLSRLGLDLEPQGVVQRERAALWREALLPNAGAPFGVRTVAGFSSILLARPQALLAEGRAAGLDELELNALLGAELLVYTLADVARVHSALTPVADGGLWRLGRLRQTRPWAAVYQHPTRVRDAAAARAARVAAGPEEAVLEAEPRPGGPPRRVEAQVRLLAATPDALELEVDTPHPGVLVVREAFARGWSAEVDGAPAPVLAADAMFRGVELEAGRHRVQLRYRVPGWRLGLALSALGALALAVCLGRGGGTGASRPWGRGVSVSG